MTRFLTRLIIFLAVSLPIVALAKPNPGGRPPGHHGGWKPGNWRPGVWPPRYPAVKPRPPGRPPIVGILPPRPPGGVIVVKPGHVHRPPPHRLHYSAKGLRDIATFALFAGVAYAVVDNVFYRKQGDQYVYDANPPAGSYTVMNTPATSGSYHIGSVVSSNALPMAARTVTVNGIVYREYEGTWFAPMAGSNQFIVVTSPF